MKKIYTLLFAVLFLSSISQAQVYVDVNATGLNDGTSWTDALTELQQGMVMGQGTGQDVWVAEGIYKPTNGSDRSISFNLMDNVATYGGFNGTETSLGQRNPDLYRTMLSGDIGSNNTTDNSYHVINNFNVGSSAILDGFIILSGRADATSGGGAGMINTSSSPIIRNCTFVDNQTILSNSPTNPLAYGGAVYNIDSSPTFINCVFEFNTANTRGGAIYSTASSGGPVTKIYNCVFDNNLSLEDGGAISGEGVSFSIINSTFSNNSASNGTTGSAIHTSTASYTIANSIIWNSTSPQIIQDNLISVTNSIVQGGYTGSNNSSDDPNFTDATDGDFSFDNCSPAVGHGDNSLLVPEILNDIIGNPRKKGLTVDAGAYENLSTIEPIFLGTTPTDATCNRGSDGIIDLITGGGGAAKDIYLDNVFQGTGITQITGLAAGTYDVRADIVGGCEKTNIVVISEPTAITATIQTQAAICAGNLDGKISVVASGSTPSYQYSIDGTNFSGTGDFTQLAAGNYTVSIKDANDCLYTEQVTVNEPSGIISSSQATNISCNGQVDGSLLASLSGGTPPYLYNIDGGTFSSNGSFTSLAAGTYLIVSKDANGCLLQENHTIVEPAVLSFAFQKSDVLCNGDSSGVITITGAGGTPPFEYSSDGTNFQSSNVLTGLAAGDHDVIIRDGRGCGAFAFPKVTVSEPAVLSLTTQSTDIITCNGDTNGIVVVTGSGGTAPFEYSTDGASFQSSDSLTSLGAGDYTITIKDANGCTTTTIENITEPTALTLSASFDGTGVVLTATGGAGAYTYSLDGTTFQTSNTFVLGNGQYTFTVKDGNNCVVTTTETLLITALGDLDFDQISLYPNPTTNEVYLDDLKAISEIRIIDQSGRTVYRELIESLNVRLELGELEVGVYTILALDKKGNAKKFKLLKN